MTCVERQYIPIIRLKLNCEDPEPINVGFARHKARPQMRGHVFRG